jgi:hypothetical protein
MQTFLAEIVPKAVVYLFNPDSDGNSSNSVNDALGTGFIVSVPSKTDITRSLNVLFTARHIVDPHWAASNVQNPDRIYIRMNRKRSNAPVHPDGVLFGRVDLRVGGKVRFFVPTDDTIDAAAIVLPPNSIPLNQAKTIKALGSVYTAGLVPGATVVSKTESWNLLLARNTSLTTLNTLQQSRLKSF